MYASRRREQPAAVLPYESVLVATEESEEGQTGIGRLSNDDRVRRRRRAVAVEFDQVVVDEHVKRQGLVGRVVAHGLVHEGKDGLAPFVDIRSADPLPLLREQRDKPVEVVPVQRPAVCQQQRADLFTVFERPDACGQRFPLRVRSAPTGQPTPSRRESRPDQSEQQRR